MAKKLTQIDYTSRDFDSIRNDLENFAKRYYPDTYKDFNKASFGSLMLDTVAYVGDILSYYLDYQTNESFLDSALEYNNVVRLSRQLGYKQRTSPASYGILTFYIEVPAALTGLGADPDLIPVLQAGSTFSSIGGGFYTLLDDVNFGEDNNQIVVGSVDAVSGAPTTFVIRATGRAVSGRNAREEVEVGSFERFFKFQLGTANISNVLRVVDTEGNQYAEVDHLSQNIIYRAIRNSSASRTTVPNLLRATPVPRRFVVETVDGNTFLQFGYGSTSNNLTNPVVDPTEVVLDLNGRDYTTDIDFDPTKLISTDKFGIAPSNTTLTVDYRFNTTSDVNAAIHSITGIVSADFKFQSQGSVSRTSRTSIQASLEVTNEEPFVGSIKLPSSEEVRQRAFSYFATQNRAVTAQDYQAIIYGMPAKFGSIKRCLVAKDVAEFKRNINVYVMSETNSGKLIKANATLKNNLKNWLLNYKMINDTIDIIDAAIVNFGIDYEVLLDLSANKYTVINLANEAIARHFSQQLDIGQSISITDIYKTLNKVDGVVDVTAIEIKLKNGGIYSESSYDMEAALSADGRRILGEKNIIFELKYPNIDIKGSVK
tara:strand:- start:1126 stop:2919 length:1794 start_codon:yes stop_codon:yes gene_type:complete